MRHVLRGSSDRKQQSIANHPLHLVGPHKQLRYVACCMSAISCQLAKFPFVRCSQLSCMPGQGIKRLWTLPISPKKDSVNLKVLQWNVLADGLAQHGDFVKVHIT